ncbi:MAG: hypothetical protein ACI8Z0_001253, partial [Lentimonas sp.]
PESNAAFTSVKVPSVAFAISNIRCFFYRSVIV